MSVAPIVPTRAGLSTASTLQELLATLLALALDAKQVHWNLTGPGFLPLHALTDEIANDANAWADRVAERAVAIGFSADARPGTVAAATDRFPTGRISDREAVTELLALIGRIRETILGSLADLETTDAVSHSIAVDVLGGLEKYRWMLAAQAP